MHIVTDMECLGFCCETETELDIDLYVRCPDDFEDEDDE